MANSAVRSVYMTFPDEAAALDVAGALLSESLIACANIFPAGRSLYRWQGEVVDEAEVVVIVKSTSGLLERLVSRVNDLHPYDTPCVVALACDGGDRRYLDWVEEQTATGSRPGNRAAIGEGPEFD
ncbi:MAG: divalent-cation tolerance protein CutA [Trueperaceae bacterium]